MNLPESIRPLIEQLSDLAEVSAVQMMLAARMAALAQRQPVSSKPESDPDRLLSVPQTAELLGYRASFVYELCRNGTLACVRDRKFVRIRKSALDAFIAAREQRGPLPLKLSNMLTSFRDRNGDEAQAQTTRTHANRTRRADRGPQDNRVEMGDRGGTDT